MCNSVQFVGCSSVLVGTVVAVFAVCTIGSAPVALPIVGIVAGIALVVFGAYLLDKADRGSRDNPDLLLSKKCVTVIENSKNSNQMKGEKVKEQSKQEPNGPPCEEARLPLNSIASNASFEALHNQCGPKPKSKLRLRFEKIRERNRRLAIVREQLLKYLGKPELSPIS